jgi:hypothetical protein
MRTVGERLIAIAALTSGLPLAAQWLNHPDLRTPRTNDGRPDLTAPAPRMKGKLDLSGVWQAERTPINEFTRVLGRDLTTVQIDLSDITKHVVNVFWGVQPAEEPLRPEGMSILKQRMARPTDRPLSRCLPVGVPAVMFTYAFKMIQTPQEIVMLFETGDPARQVYTDGRSLPKEPEPSWMGSSVGRWEGDTLIVETIGFKEMSWLDFLGHPRSESMHITERYRRRDFGRMDVEITFDDPKYYTRPFTIKTGLRLIPDSDVIEYVCSENEKDRAHM